jgi:hypothetical protein
MRWPYTEPHYQVSRWKVVTPAGTTKGIAEEDARDIAEENDGAVYRSWVVMITDGPDKGTEILGPWTQVRP